VGCRVFSVFEVGVGRRVVFILHCPPPFVNRSHRSVPRRGLNSGGQQEPLRAVVVCKDTVSAPRLVHANSEASAPLPSRRSATSPAGAPGCAPSTPSPLSRGMPDTLHTCEDLKAAALAGSQTVTYLAAKLRELGRCVPARRACCPRTQPNPNHPHPPDGGGLESST